ncbi:MAG: hypothetical protein U0L18_05210 [Acutalibacteraceae bacterium]|nr:hypothetical protein [Acutalibacteraceae bacterium]
MGNYNDYYQAIYEIKDCLKKDLFGVSDEYEILEDVEPLSAYVTGILYPRKASQISDNSSNLDFFDEKDININADIEIESNDDTITEANKYKPSSMGISAMIPSAVKKLPVIFECGTYKHSEEIKIIEKQVSVKSQSSDDEVITETKERLVNYYSRIPRKFSVEFNIPDKNCTISEICLGEIQARINLTIRKIMPDGSKLITVTVVNEAIEKNKLHFRNETALFQCKVSVNSEYSFLPVYQNLYPESDIESQIKCLLYRTVKNYGYGHGCSVTYEESEKGVFEISSDFIPSEEVLQMMPGKIENEEILYLNNWKCSERNKLCKKLEVFIDEYYKWKECKKEESDNLDLFCSATSEILRRIELCINRLKNGVRTLLTDDYAWKAFVFMNEAMLLQRVKTKYQKAETVKWYPFQLAYILQIIPDITNAESEYHNTVDLLWFPTGGGKTEAYLGVAAFTIFYRRLSGCAVNNGVAVIMRYTLRLLTIQQFERAAAMVCACEYIRRVNNLSGGEISIGLWIGSGMTPNHIDKAKEVLQKLKQNKDEKIYEGNPVQITKCPWCGKDIDVTGYDITADGMTICCKDNPECEFHKKLPIYVVDDDIYRNKPTFLLSTIDKFARITWVEESKNLFGVDDTPHH